MTWGITHLSYLGDDILYNQLFVLCTCRKSILLCTLEFNIVESPVFLGF